MTALVWRKEPPDQPGWWWTEIDGAPRIVQVIRHTEFFRPEVKTTKRDHGLWAVTDFEGDSPKAAIKATGGRWAGPIPEPEEAQK